MGVTMKVTKVMLESITNDMKVLAKQGVVNRPKYVVVLNEQGLKLVPKKESSTLKILLTENQTESFIERFNSAIITRTLGKYKESINNELEILLTKSMLLEEKREARNKKGKERVVKMLNKYSRNK